MKFLRGNKLRFGKPPVALLWSGGHSLRLSREKLKCKALRELTNRNLLRNEPPVRPREVVVWN